MELQQRELKCRVWDFGKKDDISYKPRMSKPFYLTDGFVEFNDDMLPACMLRDIDRSNDNKPRFSIMLYTGIIDVNGVEVCEGDILSKSFMDGVDQKSVVVWHDNMLCLRVCDKYRPLADCFDKHYGAIEIVGNIYKNENILGWSNIADCFKKGKE